MQNLYIKIPDGANVVIDKLYENGHSAFVVGGCVRDFILEKEPHDWDICTDALPEQVMQIFGEKNVIPTGIKHGTVTVLIGNDNYEVTTYRIDGMYSDGRRPDNVEFTQNLIEDLSRRDFSINAMAYNDKIGLIDPFDGISDIKNRRICCVGDPGKRFGEDYLRILRAIRFSSTFGFIIDKHTRMVAAVNAPNLRMLANERVGAEIRKIRNQTATKDDIRKVGKYAVPVRRSRYDKCLAASTEVLTTKICNDVEEPDICSLVDMGLYTGIGIIFDAPAA